MTFHSIVQLVNCLEVCCQAVTWPGNLGIRGPADLQSKTIPLNKQEISNEGNLISFIFAPVVSESRFFNLETRMRVSPIQSRSSRRDREFLTLTLRLRDETEKKFPPISGIETRSRFIIFTLRLRDENENSLDLISFFETRPRILKLAIFPWNQAWTASLFCMQFLGG